MIKEWFSAKEFADLCLPGLPTSERSYQIKAKEKAWKSRPRSARGGGVEYHVSSLPPAAQIALVEKIIGTDTLAELRAPVIALADQGQPTGITADERRAAKLAIITLYKQFKASSSMPTMQAERLFVSFYEKEKLSGKGDIVPSWIFDVYPSFSVPTLRRWRAVREKDDAFSVLGGRYGNRKGTGVIETAEKGQLKEFIIAVMLKHPHITGGHMRDLARAKFGETVLVKGKRSGETIEKELPHVRTIERFMNDWRNNNASIYMKITNPDGHKNKYMISAGRADAGIERLNQLWEIDASPADVLCIDGRYAIYGIIDVWSRRTMYMVTKTPRTAAALLLIRKAILSWGVPEIIRTDNGSDFTSHRFINALASIGIEQDICPPFSGDKKAFVERSFRTLQHSLMPHLPGYIGHSVKDRKEIESRRSFAKRIGEDSEKAFAVELDHAGLQSLVDRWTTEFYLHHPHTGLNKISPFTRVQSWDRPIRRIEHERALDMLLAPLAGQDGFRTVGKKGVSITHGNFLSGNLIPYIGKRVMVRCDPEDMGTIFCFDENGRFITEAKCFEREGVNPVAAAAEAKAQQKAFERGKIDPLRKIMKKITPEMMAPAMLDMHAKNNANVTALPMKSEVYRTSALDEAHRATMKPQERAGNDLDKAMEIFEKEFKAHKEKVPELTDEERWWNRASGIELRLNNGEDVPETDLAWHSAAQKKHWYIARAAFEQMKRDQESNV